MTGFAIRPAVDGDLDRVLAIEAVSFPAGERWSANAWAEELAGTDRLVLVAGQPVVAVATFQLVDQTVDLHRIMVDPASRRAGLGRELLLRGIECAGRRGGGRMLLEVRADNEAAIALYRSLGFTPLATRSNYYGPGADALVMERALAGDAPEGEPHE